jgi:putative transposase
MQNWSNWHHAPSHRFTEKGSYFLTARTFNKEHHFRRQKALDFLTQTLLTQALRFEWEIHAFAVFSNHYHIVAYSQSPENLPRYIQALHSISSIEMNKIDGTPARKLWYQYWDTLLTDSVSYHSRFRYVQENAVKHKLALRADAYPWCSAGDYLLRASAADQKRLLTFPIDQLNIEDNFEPIVENE